jgi:hypothetical protein
LQVILSIAFGVGQLCQKSRTRFPGDFAIRIEVPHGVAAFLVLMQNLRYELTFGEINMVQFYVLVGDTDPEPQGFVHGEFHAGLPGRGDLGHYRADAIFIESAP